MNSKSDIFDQWVAPASPEEIIDGGKEELAQNIADLCNDPSFMRDSGYKDDYVGPAAQRDIVQAIWDEAVKRYEESTTLHWSRSDPASWSRFDPPNMYNAVAYDDATQTRHEVWWQTMTDGTDSGYAYRTTVQGRGVGTEESGPLDADNLDDAIAEYAQLWKTRLRTTR